MDEQTSVDVLKIGDYITLIGADIGGFMSAEGILSNGVYVDERTSTISDSLFCIHLQRQYSAFKELESLQKSLEENGSEIDSSSLKYLAALKKGRDNEQNLNETNLRRAMGTPVIFGDKIQLQVGQEKIIKSNCTRTPQNDLSFPH